MLLRQLIADAGLHVPAPPVDLTSELFSSFSSERPAFESESETSSDTSSSDTSSDSSSSDETGSSVGSVSHQIHAGFVALSEVDDSTGT